MAEVDPLYTIEDQGEYGYAIFDHSIGQIIAKGFSSYEQAEGFIDGGPQIDESDGWVFGSTLMDI